MVSIIVDSRESALLSAISGASSANLHLGDVQVKYDENNSFIFERKTLSDLAASIKDGRYREQKARILAAIPPHRVTYIIEHGTHDPIPSVNMYGLARNIYIGVYTSLMYRDGIHVVFLKDTQNTAQWIADFAQKLARNPDKFVMENQPPCQYSDALKIKSQKQANLTPNLAYKMMLGQIPGISMKLAESISEVYPSMHNLIDNLNLENLEKIPLIGKKKAQKIIEYLAH